MMNPAIILGPLGDKLYQSVLKYGYEKAIPGIQTALQDPSGFASRIGDVVVWNGSKGQEVLAGLQTLDDTQQRIEQALISIESTQIVANTTLSSLQYVSFATVGLTSLTGVTMLWRLEALNKRFDKLSQQVKDLEDTLNAQNKAYLRNSLQNLREYDKTGKEDSLAKARDDAQYAANLYGELTYKESQSKSPRLDVLNYRGRCYLISLVAELRSRLLAEQPTEVIGRFLDEKHTIEQFARATFDSAIEGNPSLFLSEDMKNQGVTLDLMTKIYQSAERIGVFDEAHISSPSDMFEHCRTKGIKGKPLMKWRTKRASISLGKRLKYLMACLEDIDRAESLKLLAEKLEAKDIQFSDLQDQMKKVCEEKTKHSDSQLVYAYSFT